MNKTSIPESRIFSPAELRADFPILQQQIYRKRDLIYLDNAASTQHPSSVIEAMSGCYRETYANVHRGIHWLSEQVSAQFESARERVRRFINAPSLQEVIFTSGTTAAINLVARSWGEANIRAGDEILLAIFEHHSNIVPWQQVAARTGALIRFVSITPDGEFDLEDFQQKLNSKTKLVSIAATSNVLGLRVPIAKVVELAHVANCVVLVDAAQHVPHEPTDVTAWGADFVVFSGHKMLGPSGIGVLWGREVLLESMPPFLGGGGMIDRVTIDGFTPGELPAKFEAGTPPIVEAIGLGAAIDYLSRFDLAEISRYEEALGVRAIERIREIPGLRLLRQRASGIVSFVFDNISTQDVAILLDRKGFAIRAGHHCAMPLHDHLGLRSSCRASFYLYNTMEEVDAFAQGLTEVVLKLK